MNTADTPPQDRINKATKGYEDTQKSVTNLVDLAAVTLVDLVKKPFKNSLITLAVLLLVFGNPLSVEKFLSFFRPDL